MKKKTLRSEKTVYGRNMAGARSLWRADGMKEEHFGKPVIAIVNSFSQFVPGHVHLHNTGQVIKRVIESQGMFAAEFNTIAIDDGIAMGHEGMLYSLPSRELIADSVEYVCNAHCVDAMICISNCDKITPGMLMAAMRLNIPAVFVSGGPMEAGRLDDKPVDLIDAMVAAAENNVSDDMLARLEQSVCPTCGSCSGMFTANSMNCLTEALGLALPGNGTVVATHRNRLRLVKKAAKLIAELATRYYYDGDESVLPRSIASYRTFSNAMALDIAMGGSTNTVLHILAVAHEAGISFSMRDIDELSRRVPNICRVAPSSRYHIEDVNRAGGVMAILGELERNGLVDGDVARIDYPSLKDALSEWDIMRGSCTDEARNLYKSAPGGVRSAEMGSQEAMYETHDTDRVNGCIRSVSAPFSRDGGLAVLYGNLAPAGCIVKTAGVDPSQRVFTGRAVVFESQEEAVEGILGGKVKEGNAVIIRYEGPAGGPGMQEMLYPTSWLKSRQLDRKCALITDGRFSGGTSGLSVGHVSPEAAAGGAIALIREGDEIKIDIPHRTISVTLSDEELAERRASEVADSNAFRPKHRNRQVSGALRAYASFVSSADTGAVRIN